MAEYSSLSKEELKALKQGLEQEYSSIKSKGLKLDMSRGKPAEDQIRLSSALLNNLQDYSDIVAEDGTDCGNYGALTGIPEAQRFMARLLDLPVKNVFVGGNSSLNLMHDCVSFAFVHGFPESAIPWMKEEKIKFLCPSPGYDRHFAISQHFGMELIQVDLTETGPDMNQVEELVKDPLVKGMWGIPKYSNPTGITYSDDTVKRLASLKPAAPDFRILWDNAYSVHDLDTKNPDTLLNIMSELENHGAENMVIMFTSTSKISFPGSGISAVGASTSNLDWLKGHMSLQTISYDKINQLRHARYFNNGEAVTAHMEKQAEKLRPKFEIVESKLHQLDGLGITSWSKPKGGYFISLDVVEGCAKRVVALCKEAGVVLTPAGATHPYGKDPLDRTIRIAPTFPPVEELKEAANLLCLCVKLAAVEKYLA